MDRAACLKRWRANSEAGTPVIGAGAGTGISAKCAEMAGADLIIIYNSGRYRMAGRGSLAGLMPYGDANAIVVEMAREVLPVVRKTPVLAGVCGTDPFRIMNLFLRDLKRLGFSGVQNFPTVGLIDGSFRESLEETGMGYAEEVEMIGDADDVARVEPRPHAARGVREDRGLDAEQRQGADRADDVRRLVALVEMKASLEHDDGHAPADPVVQGALVAGRRRARESLDLGPGERPPALERRRIGAQEFPAPPRPLPSSRNYVRKPILPNHDTNLVRRFAGKRIAYEQGQHIGIIV